MIYNDFYFNGKKLSDFGGKVIRQEDNPISLIPSKNHITYKNNNADGEKFVKTSKNPRTFRREIFIENLSDRNAFAEWLDVNEEVWFYDVGDDKKIKVMIDDVVEIDVNYNYTLNSKDYYSCLLSIKFIAYDPYYYSLNDNNVTISANISGTNTFNNLGNTNSLPSIKFLFSGSGVTVKFLLNDEVVTVTECNNYLQIDSVNEVVRDSSRNRFGKMTGKFPVLKPGANKIQVLQGGVTSIEINCNSRYV